MNHTTSPRRKLEVAFTAVLVVLLIGGMLLYLKLRRPTSAAVPLDQIFGLKKIAGVAESGFYNPETGNTPPIPFRWTNGSARLSIPFDMPAPVAIHVRLGLTVPRPTKLDLRVNGNSLISETINPRGELAQTFPLAEFHLTSPLEIEILSDSFVPSKENKDLGDTRQLGIRVHGITVIQEFPDVTGVNLVAQKTPGVEEAGWHNLETSQGQPCRWTDGSAKFIVPVRSDSHWKKMAITAEIPDRPNWRVKVAINGKSFFDEEVKSGTLWTKELPIDSIDTNKAATIEISSTSIEPGTIKNKDGRRLGIRVRKVILLGD